MRFDVLTLFPGFFAAPLGESIIGRAISSGIIEVRTRNIRDYTTDRHRTTDDAPYGGGAGMVLKVEPVAAAIDAASNDNPLPDAQKPFIILTSPQGRPLSHELSIGLSKRHWIVIICGRYEGVDARVSGLVDMEVSTGDYVLTGGEIPALTIIDATARHISWVLGKDESSVDESFANGLLEYPQYTRPEVWQGQAVPEVLLSGNHAEIAKWRRLQSIKATFESRPELLAKAKLTDDELRLVEGLKEKSEGK